jgi:hypothetical protein
MCFFRAANCKTTASLRDFTEFGVKATGVKATGYLLHSRSRPAFAAATSIANVPGELRVALKCVFEVPCAIFHA